MATGGIFYPLFFPGIKKTAFGINHEHSTNFDATLDNLYEKGVQMKKRGAFGLLVEEGRNIELDIINIYNTETQKEIIERYICKLFTTNYPINLFTKTVCYKNDKNNIAVKEFKNRMDLRNDVKYPPPLNGARFPVVVADYYPYEYDIKGIKRTLTVGEKYEYLNYMVDKNLKPDLSYYISTGLLSLCSMILLPTFYIDNNDKEVDIEMGLKKSKKYVESLCDSYKKDITCNGPAYKKIYSIVKKTILDNGVFSGYNGGNLLPFLVQQSKKNVLKECNKVASMYLSKSDTSIKTQLMYKNRILVCMTNIFEKKLSEINVDNKLIEININTMNKHIENEVVRLREFDDKKIKILILPDQDYINGIVIKVNEIVRTYMIYVCIYQTLIKINTNQNLFDN